MVEAVTEADRRHLSRESYPPRYDCLCGGTLTTTVCSGTRTTKRVEGLLPLHFPGLSKSFSLPLPLHLPGLSTFSLPLPFLHPSPRWRGREFAFAKGTHTTSSTCKGGSHERAASGHAHPVQLSRGAGRPTHLYKMAVHNHRQETSATTLAHTHGGRVRQSARRSVERGSSALSQGRIEVPSPHTSEASQAEGARLTRRFRDLRPSRRSDHRPARRIRRLPSRRSWTWTPKRDHASRDELCGRPNDLRAEVKERATDLMPRQHLCCGRPPRRRCGNDLFGFVHRKKRKEE